MSLEGSVKENINELIYETIETISGKFPSLTPTLKSTQLILQF